jgi:hypothetical protein
LKAVIERGNCQLIIPPGIITFLTYTGGTIIDLSFITDQLVNNVLECQSNPLFDHGSDHQPVLTKLQLAVSKATPVKRRCWKQMDQGKALACIANLVVDISIRTAQDIEKYAKYLSEHIHYALDQAVPWKKESPYANPWWTPQVAEAVAEARATHRAWLATRSYIDRRTAVEARQRRAKAIMEAKRESYRQFVAETTQGDGLWKLSKWSYGKQRGLPQVPTLSGASSFEGKVDMLKKRFFPTIQANLEDITTQAN